MPRDVVHVHVHVHVHEPMVPSVSLTALLCAPAALVGTFHRYAEEPGSYRTFGPSCRAATACLDVRVAVSDAARRHVAETCPGDYRIVPNGIDIGAAPARRTNGHGRRIAFVGRADPRKGLHVLIEAFAGFPADSTLDLVGVEWDEVPVPSLGTEPLRRVRAHGRIDDSRRDEILAAADVFCAPYRSGESFGITVAEAMAAGLPVVASRVGGVPELLADGAGLVVPPDDAAALRDAIASMLEQPGERLRRGEVAREQARRFDWSQVTPPLLDVYAEAIDRAVRSRAGPSSRRARSTAGRASRPSAPAAGTARDRAEDRARRSAPP